jgi:RNA polymerase sigma-70 factor (ECF subfamily)
MMAPERLDTHIPPIRYSGSDSVADMGPNPGEITQLLTRFRAGDHQAEGELLEIVYAELRRIAAYRLNGERGGHILQPTALVNEAYMRLIGQRHKDWENRSHFFAVSAEIMRQVLVDYARAANAQKRQGALHAIPLNEGLAFSCEDPAALLELNVALTDLAKWDERQARIVEYYYFGGLSTEEIAEMLSVSTRTIKRELAMARAWLFDELKTSS